MTSTCHFGPAIEGDQVRFRLWAPDAGDVVLEIKDDGLYTMDHADDGWRVASVRASSGARYRFRVGDTAVPDPASRRQDGGVHGWSVVCAPHAAQTWRGRPWNETVLYELHVGLSGGYRGAIKILPKLAELGITAVELMPIAAFPGSRNWGYDGVLPFSPTEAYGTPDDLRRLVAQAHKLGLMIFLDVVYNHFGPDGNYLPLYAKRFFRDDIATPWGAAIDFRRPEVRQFFQENAFYWLGEFGFDGLRFDAVHAIRDEGWLPQLARTIRQHWPDRHIHLVLENENNEARFLREGYDAQWNDDFHHAVHVLLTGEHKSYYVDFKDAPAQKLARALSEGFIYQGEPAKARGGEPRGTPSFDLAPHRFVSFLQNHDQIGNRGFGERLLSLAEPDAVKAAVALLLLSPQIPLIFMGEEIGSRAPFLYFTDNNPELARAVREGREREFGALACGADAGALPDPNSLETFLRSRPFEDAPNSDEWIAHYRHLLDIRREFVMPVLTDAKSLGANALADKAVVARWRLGNGRKWTIASNLGDRTIAAEFPEVAPIYGERAESLAACTTLAWIE